MPQSEPLIDIARRLASGFAARAPRWDRDRAYPWANVAELSEAGLMGATIPVEFGGRSTSFAELLPVIEEVAAACTLTARILVEANMGALSAVMSYGSADHKQLVAREVLSGDKPAICITEPEAGSDARAMSTTARKVPGGYRISGTKHWITGGGVSRVHLIFAQVESDDNGQDGIGAFLVICNPAQGEMPDGFAVTRRERTMGLCGMPEAELHFTDLFVPESMRLMTPSGPQKAFADLMSAYNSQRVGAGTIALGTARGAMDHATRFLKTRQQFDRPLAEFQGLQWMLADMDVKLAAARALLADAAAASDPFPDPTRAARAKLFASEAAIEVVNDALQMFGAKGYGDTEPLERMYRDVRMFTIGGGTAQVLRNQIAGHVLGRRLRQRPDGQADQRAKSVPEPLAAE